MDFLWVMPTGLSKNWRVNCAFGESRRTSDNERNGIMNWIGRGFTKITGLTRSGCCKG